MRIQLQLGEGDLLDGEFDPPLVGMNAPPFVPGDAVEAQNRGQEQDREERSMSSHEGSVCVSGFVSGCAKSSNNRGAMQSDAKPPPERERRWQTRR
jgi:hypothetical protein